MSCQRTPHHPRSGPKRRISRWSWRGARLALIASVIVCAQACLVPQSVDPIQTVAHSPPRFDVSAFPSYLLDTYKLTLYRQGPQDVSLNCHCEIQIPPLPIIEDDPTVDLQVHWFIDYDLAVPRSLAPWPGSDLFLQGSFDNPSTLRSINNFNFDADSAGIVVSGSHVLEVVVGERNGFDSSPTAPFPNRTMLPGYELAVYKFVIDVHIEQTSQVPTCPSNLPSVRVCQ